MRYHEAHDLGANFKDVIANTQRTAAGAAIALVAGATEDGVKVTGFTIDRKDFLGGTLRIGYTASLADTKTIAFAVERQTSADDLTWATATVVQASTVADTGTTGGTDESGVVEVVDDDFDVEPRYVRYNITPTMSATATDIAVWTATMSLYGTHKVPV